MPEPMNSVGIQKPASYNLFKKEGSSKVIELEESSWNHLCRAAQICSTGMGEDILNAVFKSSRGLD